MNSLLKRCDHSASLKRNISVVFAQKFSLSCKASYYIHYSFTARGLSCNSAYYWSGVPIVVSGDTNGGRKYYTILIFIIHVALHMVDYPRVRKFNFINMNPCIGGSDIIQKQSTPVPIDYTEVNSIGSIRIHIKCGKALPQSKVRLSFGFSRLLPQVRQCQKGSSQCANCSHPTAQSAKPLSKTVVFSTPAPIRANERKVEQPYSDEHSHASRCKAGNKATVFTRNHFDTSPDYCPLNSTAGSNLERAAA